jgi:hypothetical protein
MSSLQDRASNEEVPAVTEIDDSVTAALISKSYRQVLDDDRNRLQKIRPADERRLDWPHVQMSLQRSSLSQDPPLPQVRQVDVSMEPLRRQERPHLLPLIDDSEESRSRGDLLTFQADDLSVDR